MAFSSGTRPLKTIFSVRQIFRGTEMQRAAYFGFQTYPGLKSSKGFIF